MEGYLSHQYVFVYSRTWSELLRDPDRLRESSIPAVNVIVARLVDLMSDQVSLYKEFERVSQQISIGR